MEMKKWPFVTSKEAEEAITGSDNVSEIVREGITALELIISEQKGLPVISDTFTSKDQRCVNLSVEDIDRAAKIAKIIGCSRNRVFRMACVLGAKGVCNEGLL